MAAARSPAVPKDAWTPRELRVLDRLDSPLAIQHFLDDTPYSTDHSYRSPRSVLRDRKAHCFDGAMLAAAALHRLGHRPLLLDLRAVKDDDHVLAVYQVDKCWGCVAKSNFVGLRARQPIYRTLRELALTYFEVYYNMDGLRSLRSFSTPVDLDRVGQPQWRLEDRCMRAISGLLGRAVHTPLLTPGQVRRLPPVDQKTYQANMLGTDLGGVYWPGGKKREVQPPRG